jgi:hypothetical protein
LKRWWNPSKEDFYDKCMKLLEKKRMINHKSVPLTQSDITLFNPTEKNIGKLITKEILSHTFIENNTEVHFIIQIDYAYKKSVHKTLSFPYDSTDWYLPLPRPLPDDVREKDMKTDPTPETKMSDNKKKKRFRCICQ